MLFSTLTFCQSILNLPWFSVPLSYPWGQLTSACVLSHVWLFATLWIIPCQAPLSTGIFQVRTLEWVAISSSRGSSWPRDSTHISCNDRWILYHWATWLNCPNIYLSFMLKVLLPVVSPQFTIIHYLPDGSEQSPDVLSEIQKIATPPSSIPFPL